MKKRLIAVGLTLFAASAAYVQADGRTWHACEKDSDCIFIDHGCSYGVVNRKFESQASRFYKEDNMLKDCDIGAQIFASPTKAFRVFCKSTSKGKVCDAEGKRPKREK